MFASHPLLFALSFLGALSLFLCLSEFKGSAVHALCAVLWLLSAVINPLISHKGVSVWFFLGDNPVTKESFLYGVSAGGMLAACLYWFSGFTRVFTSDRLLYLFGRVSPKLGLLLSMTLRYIPLFGRQTARVHASQKALGLYKNDNAIDAFRGGARIGGVMVTWALENGIVTADSMAARGYGCGRRSFFARYRFRRSDAVFLALTLLLSGITLAAQITGALDFAFFPSPGAILPDIRGMIGLFSYGLLCVLPLILQGTEALSWHYWKSGI